VIENALATFRLIVLANGKKGLGAFLNLIIALVWILSASLVIMNFQEDLLKVAAFVLGSYAGSYIGCVIEEKVAIGSNMLVCISSKDEDTLTNKLRELDYEVIAMEGQDKLDEKNVLIVITTRKRQNLAINVINRIDKNAKIIVQSAFAYNNK